MDYILSDYGPVPVSLPDLDREPVQDDLSLGGYVLQTNNSLAHSTQDWTVPEKVKQFYNDPHRAAGLTSYPGHGGSEWGDADELGEIR